MKSYLQRLAARAEGVNTTPSLIPTVRNEAIAQSDPTFAFAEGDAVVEPPATRKSPREATTTIESSEPVKSVPLLPSKRSAPQNTLMAGRGEITDEAPITEKIPVQPNVPSKWLASPHNVLPSDVRSNEQSSHGSFPGTNRPRSSLLVPRELNLDQNRIARSAIRASDEPANDKQNAPVAARMEPVASLEPRLMEVPPPPVSIPGGPRLVIGQMRVEVIATAPPKAREVVRVVTRTEESNKGSRVGSPISKLRFGLGQM